MGCVEKIIQNNQIIYQDCHTKKPISSIGAASIPTSGPGTELKKLLSKIGIKASENCSCNKRAKIMDVWGADQCEEKIDEIVGWLKEEATKRKLPFIDFAGKLLVKRAIKNSRKNTGK